MLDVRFVRNLNQISKKDTGIAGGKGASLGELINNKIPVPSAFVIFSNTFNFLLENNRIEIEAFFNKINYENINSIRKISKEIRDLILGIKITEEIKKDVLREFKKLKTKKVAVRSSATAEDSSIASWAGELETYLNVDHKNLFNAIKKCWASLFTPRAVFYRHEKRLDKDKISVAVVIQSMVQSKISGITFTANPVTKDRNQMVIEASNGLGEMIVGGKITPDRYFINKKDWSIVDISISRQKNMIIQKLTGWQIMKLAQLCHQIEKHYKYPQDIEWAIENNNFYILQSRPITTL
ncbi:hypothetical protein KJ750_02330 [Patescibacteria group bacterium]|nr:hypothetical protein [Patescibacteria group bacterium]MBU2263470.1 hypothetical protein [Patescibacteria group bacterium]